MEHHPSFVPDKPSDFKHHPSFVPDTAPEQGKPTNTEPSDFTGGVLKSIFSGEAPLAALKGAYGYAKGAITDIPSTIGSAITGFPHAAKTSMGPLGDMMFGGDSASDIKNGVMDFARNVRDTTSKAGSDPESFGRMMGNMTGQPLALEGLSMATPHVVPPVARTIGTGLEKVGDIMNKHTPISIATGVGTGAHMGGPLGAIVGANNPATQILKTIEKVVGNKVKSAGESLNYKFARRVSGEHVIPEVSKPDIVDGEYTTKPKTPPPDAPNRDRIGGNKSKELPPSSIESLPPSNRQYSPDGLGNQKQLEGYGNDLPPSKTFYYGPAGDIGKLVEGQEMPRPAKRKVIRNSDGNFTDKNTGEILDNSFNPVVTEETNTSDFHREISKDSPFFKKNRTQ